jgi:hypothetical protein
MPVLARVEKFTNARLIKLAGMYSAWYLLTITWCAG